MGESKARGFLRRVAVVGVMGVGKSVGGERGVASGDLGRVPNVGAVGVGESGGALYVVSTWIRVEENGFLLFGSLHHGGGQSGGEMISL